MNTTPQILHVEIEPADGGFDVDPVWSGVDRPNTGGYRVKDTKMAERLKRAMLAGAVYPEPKTCTDVNGNTYVSGPSTVLGRMMNADLKRLGF